MQQSRRKPFDGAGVAPPARAAVWAPLARSPFRWARVVLVAVLGPLACGGSGATAPDGKASAGSSGSANDSTPALENLTSPTQDGATFRSGDPAAEMTCPPGNVACLSEGFDYTCKARDSVKLVQSCPSASSCDCLSPIECDGAEDCKSGVCCQRAGWGGRHEYLCAATLADCSISVSALCRRQSDCAPTERCCDDLHIDAVGADSGLCRPTALCNLKPNYVSAPLCESDADCAEWPGAACRQTFNLFPKTPKAYKTCQPPT